MVLKPRFRLYVDEVGNSDLGACSDPNHRYLSLTGVIIGWEHSRDRLRPEMEELKQRFFSSHPDDPVILHRKELVNRKYPFNALMDISVEIQFNAELLSCLKRWQYVVITIVIDKLAHLQKYSEWAKHPYHYCLNNMVERYVYWLKQNHSIGDTLAESRGAKDDRELSMKYRNMFEHGTDHVSAADFQMVLTSKELKVKKKTDNVAGLQLADLIAHPSYKGFRAEIEGIAQPENFGAQIYKILKELKYRRHREDGHISGLAQKWL